MSMKPKPAARTSAPVALPSQPKLLVTVKEAAAMLSIGYKQTYALIMSGELASLKIGRSRRVSMRALEAYIDANLA